MPHALIQCCLITQSAMIPSEQWFCRINRLNLAWRSVSWFIRQSYNSYVLADKLHCQRMFYVVVFRNFCKLPRKTKMDTLNFRRTIRLINILGSIRGYSLVEKTCWLHLWTYVYEICSQYFYLSFQDIVLYNFLSCIALCNIYPLFYQSFTKAQLL